MTNEEHVQGRMQFLDFSYRNLMPVNTSLSWTVVLRERTVNLTHRFSLWEVGIKPNLKYEQMSTLIRQS